MKKRLRILLLVIFFVLLGGWGSSQRRVNAASNLEIEDSKNGIVIVQAGLKGSDDKFYMIKSGTGIVVCNQSGAVYVITTNKMVTVSKKQKKALIKKHKLQDSLDNMNLEIQVIVEGDVASDVTVQAKSKQDDFCVLSAQDVLKEKIALHIGDESDIKTGDEIYAVGFKGISGKKGEDSEVEIHAGKVEDAGASVKGNAYIQHSAVILSEQSGGALIDNKGYLVGMNNAAVKNKDIKSYYSLPISKIKVIMDNYGILYESREKDDAWMALKDTYEKAKRQIESGDYKAESVEELSGTLQSMGEKVTSEENMLTLQEIRELQEKLEMGEKKLVKKASKIRTIQYVLLVCVCITAIWALLSVFKYKRIKKQYHVEKESQNGALASKLENTNLKADRSVSGNFGKDAEKQEQIISDFDGERTVKLRHDFPKNDQVQMDSKKFQVNRAVLKFSLTGEEYGISAPYFTIGKRPENHLQIDKKTVSRSHAAILWHTGKYYIEDLDSANGTYVNGKVVKEKKMALSHHDIVTIADEEMEFLIKEL